MPGSIPATSQLDWLISTTAMIVLSWSRATRDLLKSFGWGIGALHRLATATMVPSPRRLPHTISLLEGDGFELVVPRCVVGGRLADAIAESAASLRRATALGRDDKSKMPRNPGRAPNLNRGCAHADRSAFPSRRIPLHQPPVPIFWRGCRRARLPHRARAFRQTPAAGRRF